MKKVLLNCFHILNERFAERFFKFEDISKLDNNAIKLLLSETDATVLTKALKRSSVTLLDKIFYNMSAKGAAVIKKDMEYLCPLTFKEIKDAQSEVLQNVKKLKREGKIKIK